ncbi:MAG: hypothetical protein AAGG02_21305 [Cyanobacteria bacterium P01_H01_bin.15]
MRSFIQVTALGIVGKSGRRNSTTTAAALQQAIEEEENLTILQQRSIQISSTFFKLNAYSEPEAFKTFRFKNNDIAKICHLTNWISGRTKRSR